MVTIIDYGIGNLNSVANMIRYVGGSCCISCNPAEIAKATKLILPGVGAFDSGMEALNRSKIVEALAVAVLERKTPILGICLGMQLMAKRSEEGGLAGLGWVDAEVRKFCFPETSRLKIPHMGWNNISILRQNPLIPSEAGQRFYFVHSYHVVCEQDEDIVSTCEYGYDFVAAIAHGNIFGMQFHPEKSHRFGMAIMRRFWEMKAC